MTNQPQARFLRLDLTIMIMNTIMGHQGMSMAPDATIITTS
jgi:hypothetical protein